jgi:integrase
MRKINRLSAISIARAKEPGRYYDGGGLLLQIGPTGTKSWLFRYQRDGRERRMGLGGIDTVSLAEARVRARQARQLILDGKDPLELKHEGRKAEQLAQARKMTFKQCAAEYLAEHSDGWKNAKHRAQWITSIERANRSFGNFDVAEIDVDVLIRFLTPIWRATPETGSRMRGRIEAVLDWATARKFRQGENPARWKGHMEHLLKAKPEAVHHPAMPFVDLPAFMAEVRARDSLSARALELTILAAARTSEVLGARWDEIDLKAAVWTVPAERMKSGREHRVPLSDRAMEILSVLHRDRSGLMFPGAKAGSPLSNMAMLQLLRGMKGNGLTVHGFRSCFSDWARERTNYPRDVVEMALAHRIKDRSERAYRRGDALDKRRRLMRDWSSFCESPVREGSVIPIGKAS